MPYADPDRERAYATAYRAAHREEQRVYRAAHREEHLVYFRTRKRLLRAAKAQEELRSGRFGIYTPYAPTLTLRQKLEAMAAQTASPYEADVARRKLELCFA